MSEIVERERAFYDRLWARTGARAVRGAMYIPHVADLAGKRMAICGCGNSDEHIQAAQEGAEVFAFDIAPAAIEKTREAAALNGVTVHADVMDFHDLRYPDNFFDIMYGAYILHHVDCDVVGREMFRCLKPGGIGFFWENSDRNPIIRWFRRLVFGVPGGLQKHKFLFVERHGTEDEYPLTDQEIGALAKIFGGNVEILHYSFVFFQLLSLHVWSHRLVRELTAWLDRVVVRFVPAVRRYSFHQEIWLQKPQKSPSRFSGGA